jgi:S1-C subfamily serine protease
VLLAINGVEMTDDNKEALKKAKHAMAPGSTATYVVKRQGGKVKLKAELGKVPAEMRAQWIGEHLVDQHSQVKMASK